MNIIQQKILDIAKLEDIEKIKRVDLLRRIGGEYPSQVTHHRNQLIKRGDLVRKDGRLIPALSTSSSLVRIPVMGEADCGEATKFADGRVTDALLISPSLLKIKHLDSTYALVARGDSMNHATVEGKQIQDGDYVVVEKRDGYIPADNDIIVSIIGGLANIKRFIRDDANRRILLLSDSYRQQDFAPIVISEDDDFQIEAKVIDIVKGVIR